MRKGVPLVVASIAVVAAAASIFIARSAHPLPDREREACGHQKDFLVRSDPLLAPLRPVDCSTVTETPPEFTWPPLQGKYTYAVILRFPDGHSETRTTDRNWLVWDKALAPGAYTWQVKTSYENTLGKPRSFTIAPNAVPFLLPGEDELLKRAKATPRPRSWANDATSPLLAIRAERRAAFNSLVKEVDDKIHLDVQPEPKAESNNANYDDTVSEQKRALAAAFAWAGTKNPRYGEEAARRLMGQARWSTRGPIGFKQNDMASRNVAWTLALGYDWTHDYLNAQQKATILEAIRARTRDMYDEYITTRQITEAPYNSHGNLTLTVTAAIAALVAGDIPEADTWFKGSVPMAIVWTSPWGGTDGGFGNGTLQAQWDTGSNLLAWYVLKSATGVDIAKKEWVRNHPRYLAYFVPPGSPGNAFGDGLEQRYDEMTARIAKALAAFAPSPLARWYASQWSGEDNERLELLLAPRAMPGAAPFPPDTPNAAVFPSIGWVAMHSNLADPARTSVYFKSSPYGSYNHSHGDQNSFMVDYKGERLAIASGYYDDYKTPHWKDWYKQTRSTNAITFDGGQGQGFDGKEFAGEITRFDSHGGWDHAVGHAEKAYGGALSKAERSVLYLRPNVIIVHDAVASATPRTWEWNIHALNRMAKLSESKIHIATPRAGMCVEMLASPEITFSQNDRFTSPPHGSNMNPRTPNQWHGAFSTAGKSADAEFLALMRIGSECTTGTTTSATAARIPGGWQVNVDGKTVKLTGGAASVD
jgi:hypothetical protein